MKPLCPPIQYSKTIYTFIRILLTIVQYFETIISNKSLNHTSTFSVQFLDNRKLFPDYSRIYPIFLNLNVLADSACSYGGPLVPPTFF